jgi:hypothetical protein
MGFTSTIKLFRTVCAIPPSAPLEKLAHRKIGEINDSIQRLSV